MYCRLNASSRARNAQCFHYLNELLIYCFNYAPRILIRLYSCEVSPFKMGFLALCALVLSLSSVIYARQYELTQTYTAQNFFEEFSFFTVCPLVYLDENQVLTFSRVKTPLTGSSNMFLSTQQLPQV